MEIQRALVDRQFDRYVLSTEGVEKHEAALPAAVLEPVSAVNTTRKAQWEARVHHNGLTADPFRSDALDGSVAYYLDTSFQLMQVVWTKTTGVQVQPIYGLTKPQQRKENASIQVAGLGVLVVNDGSGMLRILESGNAAAIGAPWEIMYEFQPLPDSATLLIQAYYDGALQRFAMVLAEPLSGLEKDSCYRVWVADASCATTSESMDVDSGAVGLQHSAFEVGITSTLPDFVAFNGPMLAMLVEGTCTLMIEAKTSVADEPMAASMQEPASEAAHATKRHHDESDIEMDVDEVLSKVPRAGIGYHGDVSDTKHAHELIDDNDLAKPLAERFRKSSIPYSSLDEPLHSTSEQAVRSPTVMDGPLEVPTPETILGGFEECDDLDPNATAMLLLIDIKQQVIQDKLDLNCRSFRYLGKSASRADRSNSAAFDASLLFQNDVHGLVFELDVVVTHLRLRHTATFPAFGFVQASKQDKKYMTYDAQARFATIGEFEKRLFVYHGELASAQEKDTHVRRQNVVEIGDHQLLGMAAVGAAVLLLSPHHAYHVRVASPAATS